MAGADRIDCTLLPRSQEGTSTLLIGHLAEHVLFAAAGHLVGPGRGKAFFDVPLYREFTQLPEYSRMPDESTILRFRHRLEKHQLAAQIQAFATLSALSLYPAASQA